MPMVAMNEEHLLNTIHRIERNACEKRRKRVETMRIYLRDHPDEKEQMNRDIESLNLMPVTDLAQLAFASYDSLREVAVHRGIMQPTETGEEAKRRRA